MRAKFRKFQNNFYEKLEHQNYFVSLKASYTNEVTQFLQTFDQSKFKLLAEICRNFYHRPDA
jgi:hypothetical protein